jgi:hypothetical protein
MATTSSEQALRVTEALPRDEQLRLIQELAEYAASNGATSVLDFCGLGQAIWQEQDAQEYVKGERASWNG